jgi:hypothetical protein
LILKILLEVIKFKEILVSLEVVGGERNLFGLLLSSFGCLLVVEVAALFLLGVRKDNYLPVLLFTIIVLLSWRMVSNLSSSIITEASCLRH